MTKESGVHTIETGILQEVRVDGHLGIVEGIIWNTTGALLRIVIGTAPGICILIRRIQLAGGKELDVTMVQAIEREIDRPGTIDGRWHITSVIRNPNEYRFAIRERVGCGGTARVGLETRVLTADDGRGGEVKEGEE